MIRPPQLTPLRALTLLCSLTDMRARRVVDDHRLNDAIMQLRHHVEFGLGAAVRRRRKRKNANRAE
jgi:hypothetical protein